MVLLTIAQCKHWSLDALEEAYQAAKQEKATEQNQPPAVVDLTGDERHPLPTQKEPTPKPTWQAAKGKQPSPRRGRPSKAAQALKQQQEALKEKQAPKQAKARRERQKAVKEQQEATKEEQQAVEEPALKEEPVVKGEQATQEEQAVKEEHVIDEEKQAAEEELPCTEQKHQTEEDEQHALNEEQATTASPIANENQLTSNEHAANENQLTNENYATNGNNTSNGPGFVELMAEVTMSIHLEPGAPPPQPLPAESGPSQQHHNGFVGFNGPNYPGPPPVGPNQLLGMVPRRASDRSQERPWECFYIFPDNISMPPQNGPIHCLSPFQTKDDLLDHWRTEHYFMDLQTPFLTFCCQRCMLWNVSGTHCRQCGMLGNSYMEPWVVGYSASRQKMVMVGVRRIENSGYSGSLNGGVWPAAQASTQVQNVEEWVDASPVRQPQSPPMSSMQLLGMMNVPHTQWTYEDVFGPVDTTGSVAGPSYVFDGYDEGESSVSGHAQGESSGANTHTNLGTSTAPNVSVNTNLAYGINNNAAGFGMNGHASGLGMSTNTNHHVGFGANNHTFGTITTTTTTTFNDGNLAFAPNSNTNNSLHTMFGAHNATFNQAHYSFDNNGNATASNDPTTPNNGGGSSSSSSSSNHFDLMPYESLQSLQQNPPHF